MMTSKDVELKALASFAKKRDSALEAMDRLPVHNVSPCIMTLEFGEVWKMYNRRVIINLETLRRHIASLTAWQSVIKHFQNDSILDVLLVDYIQPLVFELIDIPQSINNQIQQAIVRLSILCKDSCLNWKNAAEMADKLRNNVYSIAKKEAFPCTEWDKLNESLETLYNSAEAEFLRKLHGDKFHDIISPPFVSFPKPVQTRIGTGSYCFGYVWDTLNIDAVIDAASAQLQNAHNSYENFWNYSAKLERICNENAGGVYIDD